MAIKHLIISNFMPPETDYGTTPILPMALGEHITMLAACDDGTLLAILAYDARRMLTNLKAGILWPQIAALKAQSNWAYLILHDCPTPGKMTTNKATMLEFLDQTGGIVETTGWNWGAYQGCLMTIQELGVIVLTMPTEADIGPAVLALGKRDRSTKRIAPLRAMEALSTGETILLALPGIGDALTLRLLSETGGNVAAALSILTDPAYPFGGVGNATRANIRQALGLRNDEAVIYKVAEEMV